MPITEREAERLRYEAAKRKIQNNFVDGFTIEALGEGGGAAIVGILETIALAWIIAATTGPEPLTKLAATVWTIVSGLVAIGLILGILYISWSDYEDLIVERNNAETREDSTHLTNLSNLPG